jgi:hypothetical protein
LTGEKAKRETAAIRFMIDQRLKAGAPAVLTAALDAHLDEDAICAFVEGRLEEAESAPVIEHLVACSPCRHTTAQLVRLESQFESEPPPTEEGPGRVRSLLDQLASQLTPSFEEDTVFAYNDPEADLSEGSESKEGDVPADEEH